MSLTSLASFSTRHLCALYRRQPFFFLNCLFAAVQTLRLVLLTPFSLLLWQKSRRDVGNFDKEFTKMAVELTPTDKLFIMNLDQNEFQGFSYTNPEYIIQV